MSRPPKRQPTPKFYIPLLDLPGLRVRLSWDFLRGNEPGNLILELSSKKTPIQRFFANATHLRQGTAKNLEDRLTELGTPATEVPAIIAGVLSKIDHAMTFNVELQRWPTGTQTPIAIPIVPKTTAGPARQFHLPPKTDLLLWNRLVRRDDGVCVCCETPLEDHHGPTPHHMLPRTDGGKDTLDNLVLTCRRCHDRLEDAQEAILSATGRPPRRLQFVGIFAKDYAGPVGDPTPQISPTTKRKHAERVLAAYPPLHLRTMASLHHELGCFTHIDWPYVARNLPAEPIAQAR